MSLRPVTARGEEENRARYDRETLARDIGWFAARTAEYWPLPPRADAPQPRRPVRLTYACIPRSKR